MEKPPEDAEATIAELRRLRQELRDIMAAGERLKGSTSWEVSEYQERIKTVKAQLKDYAKVETLSLRRGSHTEAERCFFAPAVRHAASHFRMRTNAGPAHWSRGLWEPADDLSDYIYRLEKHYNLPRS